MDEEVAIAHDVVRHTSSSPINDYIAGALGGMVGLVVGHPFDTTKVQLQTQSSRTKYHGTMDALKHIQTQGLTRGFFRGMSWPLLSYGVINSVFFGIYGNTLQLMQHRRSERDRASYLDIYVAGCVAGAAQLVVACPVDLCKVILQSQIPHETTSGKKGTARVASPYFKGPWEAVMATVRQNGVSGCYRGLTAMAFRDIPSYGLYCAIYEYLTDVMHDRGLTDDRGIFASLMAGGTSGTVTWFSIMPFDVIKSRMQADLSGSYNGMIDCLRKTVKSEGIMALYKGTFVTCARAFPVNAATFLTYSQTLKYLS
ncbi:solute carrier family 25 member 45-like isoform X1 [Haliotis rubra]|uniref:solute carrier family 25 member 45-like isoform X1 n=2 Tax=Haliotis rubra TaxID=36100 RepID=UPI001EE5B995|nr:solute carrier family 25 member 45-like isoform X1 [Haliotis rubra]